MQLAYVAPETAPQWRVIARVLDTTDTIKCGAWAGRGRKSTAMQLLSPSAGAAAAHTDADGGVHIPDVYPLQEPFNFFVRGLEARRNLQALEMTRLRLEQGACKPRSPRRFAQSDGALGCVRSGQSAECVEAEAQAQRLEVENQRHKRVTDEIERIKATIACTPRPFLGVLILLLTGAARCFLD